MATKNTPYEVRSNLSLISFNAVDALGNRIFANQEDGAPSVEEQALASVRVDAVTSIVCKMATYEPLLADIFRRHLGLEGRRCESLNEIAFSLGMTSKRIQLRFKRASNLFNLELQFHSAIAFLQAA